MKQSTIDQKLERIRKLQGQTGAQKPKALRQRLQKVAWEEMLTARSEASLNKVIQTVDDINKLVPQIKVDTPLDLIEALELQNLLVVGDMVARVGLMRQESRGAHYRVEYPEQDDVNWLKAITVKKVNGKMVLDTLALDSNWKWREGDMRSRGWG